MTTKGWRSRVFALGLATVAAALCALAVPTAASADAQRPLNVTLTCTNSGVTGLPYGYQVTTGSGLYYPPAQHDATVSGNAKTFYLYLPTTASSLGVNTWCNGFQQAAVWEGYSYSIVPGTSTVNAVGSCDTSYYSFYPGVTYLWTYCRLSSISYS